ERSVRREDRAIERDAALFELLVESRWLAARDEVAEDLAVRADTALPKGEERLREDDVMVETIDLDDRGDPTPSIAEACLLHDDVPCRSDSPAHCAQRQIHTRHEHHDLQPRQQIAP